jgi:quinol monooxygenase YgiN
MSVAPFARLADLEVDPEQRDAFIAAVRQEMNESVRVEPGVLALYAVAERDLPSRLRFFEIYADAAATRPTSSRPISGGTGRSPSR